MKWFYVPLPEAWAHDTHRTVSNPLDIAKWSRPVFLETPGPITRSEGSLDGSCSFMYSTSRNMLSASSSFIDRQAEDKVAYDCEDRFSVARHVGFKLEFNRKLIYRFLIHQLNEPQGLEEDWSHSSQSPPVKISYIYFSRIF
jgi:hypothetical protein